MFMSSVHKVTLGSFLFGQKISLPDPDPLYPALKAIRKQQMSLCNLTTAVPASWITTS